MDLILKSLIFNVFGSPSSQDRDVLVYVPTLPKLEECKKQSHLLNREINDLYLDHKKANTNLGVLKDGVLVQVFKGTVDEVNNSILQTYEFHDQKHPLQIKRNLERDFEQKLLRVSRILLSFYSRTIYREAVKGALGGDFQEKIICLEAVDFSLDMPLGKNQESVDIRKNIAFQLGQIIGLSKGKEYYSKEDIAKDFPDLAVFLMRGKHTVKDLVFLEHRKLEFLKIAEEKLPTMKKVFE